MILCLQLVDFFLYNQLMNLGVKKTLSCLDEVEVLQKDIELLICSIQNSSTKQNFFEDEHIRYQIDETGHQIICLKRNQIENKSIKQTSIKEIQSLKNENLKIQQMLQYEIEAKQFLLHSYKSLIQIVETSVSAKNDQTLLKQLSKRRKSLSNISVLEDKENTTQQKIIQVERIVEIPVQKIIYVDREVEKIIEIERIIQIPIEKFIEIEKIVERPIQKIIEIQKIIQIDRPIEIEKIKEIIIEKIVEVQKIVEIHVPVEKIIQKIVEVQKIVQKIVQIQVPVEKIVQKIVEVQKIVQKKVEVEKIVEKIVEIRVPVEKIVQKLVEVEKIVYLSEKVSDKAQQLDRLKSNLAKDEAFVPINSVHRNASPTYSETIIQIPVETIVYREVQKFVQVPIEVIVYKEVEKIVQKIIYIQSQKDRKRQTLKDQVSLEQIQHNESFAEKNGQQNQNLNAQNSHLNDLNSYFPLKNQIPLIQSLENVHSHVGLGSDRSDREFYSVSSPRFKENQQKQLNQQQIKELMYLREQNAVLKSDIEEIKFLYDQFIQQQKQKNQGSVLRQESIESILSQNQNLQEQIYEYERIRQSLEEGKKALQTQKGVLEHEKSYLNDKYRQMQSQLSQKESQISVLRLQTKQLARQVQSTLIFQNQKESQIEIQEDNQNLRGVIQELTSELEGALKELQRLRRTNDQLQEGNNALTGILQLKKASQQQLLNHFEDQRYSQLMQEFKLQRDQILYQLSMARRELDQVKALYGQELESSEERDAVIDQLHREIRDLRIAQQQRIRQSQNKEIRPKTTLNGFHHSQVRSNQNINGGQKQFSENRLIERTLQGSRSAGSFISLRECSASPMNRGRLLSSNSVRKGLVLELKRIVRDYPNAEIGNKVLDLVQQLYLDAESKERAGAQLREIVAGLQSRVETAERGSSEIVNVRDEEDYVMRLQASLQQSQRLLSEGEHQKLRLLGQIAALERENHEIRLELESGHMDNQTQSLIEQLAQQLESERLNNRKMMGQIDTLRRELVESEHELKDKNSKIRYLNLNLSKREGSLIQQSQRY